MAKAKIHHTQKAMAAKLGVELREKGELVEAFWPSRGASVLGATASEAIDKMKEMQEVTMNEELNEEAPADDVEDDESVEDEAEKEESSEGDQPEEEERVSSSVVKEKYRAIYAERGHPAHCGDWLAQVLNNLILAEKGGADIERFRQICEMNDVDMSKYKTTGNGWQGRYRMTGRNLLAKVLQEREFLLAPGMNGELEEIPVPTYWKEERKPAK